MTTRRKHWQTPVMNAKSVSEVLGAGETAGPMAPGLVIGPPPKFGPPGTVDATMGPPAGPPTGSFGPEFVTVLGPTGLSAMAGGPPSGPPVFEPAPIFGPPDRLPDFGPPGAIAAVYGPPAFAALEGPPVPSDIRLKEDITSVGSSAEGFPLYTFRYRGQQGLYQGVMAQDVMKTRPDAVIVDEDGFYMVDYGKLGIEFRRVQ